jgi:hypothetical protein
VKPATRRTLRFSTAMNRVTITVESAGRKPVNTVYAVQEYEGDFGRSFALLKLDGEGEAIERYDVNTSGFCSCIDFERYGVFCKHQAAVAKLIEEGKVGGIPAGR